MLMTEATPLSSACNSDRVVSFSGAIFLSKILVGEKKGAFPDCIPQCSLRPCQNTENCHGIRKRRLKEPDPRGLAKEMTNGFQDENSFKFILTALALKAVLLGSLSSMYFPCELSAKAIMKACLQIPKI